MDHFLQIPQIGREWEDMLESYTTLGYLAGVTGRLRLGTLVTGITYRNLAHLAKIVATLDVLSGGRAVCGLGTAWFEREHRLYGCGFPPRGRALRAARGRARAAAADVGPGRAAVRGPHGHRRRRRLLPAAAAGADPDPRRRLRRAPDAAARRAARRRLQPVRRPRHRAPQARRAARALRDGAARPGDGRRHPPRARPGDRRRPSRASPPPTRPSRSTSAATASSPRRGWRRRSSGSATRRGRRRSRASPR